MESIQLFASSMSLFLAPSSFANLSARLIGLQRYVCSCCISALPCAVQNSDSGDFSTFQTFSSAIMELMKARWLVVHSFLSHKSNQNKKRLNVGPKEPSQNIRHFSRVGRLDFYYIGFCPDIKKRANSLLAHQKVLAEREGFEPPVRFPVHLISSQAPSTGLGHLSARFQLVSSH